MAHKLLLADDSVTIQRVIELTFADEDVEVTTVGDGQMAIERLDVDPPDIVLADVDMPKRDGYEVAAYVKSRPKLAHIPVVLLTGAFEPIDQVRATASGSSDVLAKPFEPQMVINRVKELLGKKRQDDVQPYDAAASTVAARPAPPQMQSMMDDSMPGRMASGESQAISLDEYFDQLDAAFSNLHPGPAASASAAQDDWLDVVSEREASRSATSAAAAPTNAAAPTDAIEKVAGGAPVTIAPAVMTVPAAPPPPEPRVEPLKSAAPASAPVEQIVPSTNDTVVVAAPPVPVSVPAPAPASASVVESDPAPIKPRITTNPFATLSAVKAEAARPKITEELIEEVITRVLQRMTDNVVRQTVTDIVAQTAERLVQEEIDRIKNSGDGD
jgi:CheY-like chemotaxis protein